MRGQRSVALGCFEEVETLKHLTLEKDRQRAWQLVAAAHCYHGFALARGTARMMATDLEAEGTEPQARSRVGARAPVPSTDELLSAADHFRFMHALAVDGNEPFLRTAASVNLGWILRELSKDERGGDLGCLEEALQHYAAYLQWAENEVDADDGSVALSGGNGGGGTCMYCTLTPLQLESTMTHARLCLVEARRKLIPADRASTQQAVVVVRDATSRGAAEEGATAETGPSATATATATAELSHTLTIDEHSDILTTGALIEVIALEELERIGAFGAGMWHEGRSEEAEEEDEEDAETERDRFEAAAFALRAMAGGGEGDVGDAERGR